MDGGGFLWGHHHSESHLKLEMSGESDSSDIEPSSSEAISSAVLPPSSRKKAVRFNLQCDIALLQKVFTAKPWAAVHGRTREAWETIVSEIYAVISKDRSGSEAVQASIRRSLGDLQEGRAAVDARIMHRGGI